MQAMPQFQYNHLSQEAEACVCHFNLIRTGTIPENAHLADSKRFWQVNCDEYCPNCPVFDECPLPPWNE